MYLLIDFNPKLNVWHQHIFPSANLPCWEGLAVAVATTCTIFVCNRFLLISFFIAFHFMYNFASSLPEILYVNVSISFIEEFGCNAPILMKSRKDYCISSIDTLGMWRRGKKREKINEKLEIKLNSIFIGRQRVWSRLFVTRIYSDGDGLNVNESKNRDTHSSWASKTKKNYLINKIGVQCEID